MVTTSVRKIYNPQTGHYEAPTPKLERQEAKRVSSGAIDVTVAQREQAQEALRKEAQGIKRVSDAEDIYSKAQSEAAAKTFAAEAARKEGVKAGEIVRAARAAYGPSAPISTLMYPSKVAIEAQVSAQKNIKEQERKQQVIGTFKVTRQDLIPKETSFLYPTAPTKTELLKSKEQFKEFGIPMTYKIGAFQIERGISPEELGFKTKTPKKSFKQKVISKASEVFTSLQPRIERVSKKIDEMIGVGLPVRLREGVYADGRVDKGLKIGGVTFRTVPAGDLTPIERKALLFSSTYIAGTAVGAGIGFFKPFAESKTLVGAALRGTGRFVSPVLGAAYTGGIGYEIYAQARKEPSLIPELLAERAAFTYGFVKGAGPGVGFGEEVSKGLVEGLPGVVNKPVFGFRPGRIITKIGLYETPQQVKLRASYFGATTPGEAAAAKGRYLAKGGAWWKLTKPSDIMKPFTPKGPITIITETGKVVSGRLPVPKTFKDITKAFIIGRPSLELVPPKLPKVSKPKPLLKVTVSKGLVKGEATPYEALTQSQKLVTAVLGEDKATSVVKGIKVGVVPKGVKGRKYVTRSIYEITTTLPSAKGPSTVAKYLYGGGAEIIKLKGFKGFEVITEEPIPKSVVQIREGQKGWARLGFEELRGMFIEPLTPLAKPELYKVGYAGEEVLRREPFVKGTFPVSTYLTRIKVKALLGPKSELKGTTRGAELMEEFLKKPVVTESGEAVGGGIIKSLAKVRGVSFFKEQDFWRRRTRVKPLVADDGFHQGGLVVGQAYGTKTLSYGLKVSQLPTSVLRSVIGKQISYLKTPRGLAGVSRQKPLLGVKKPSLKKVSAVIIPISISKSMLKVETLQVSRTRQKVGLKVESIQKAGLKNILKTDLGLKSLQKVGLKQALLQKVGLKQALLQKQALKKLQMPPLTTFVFLQPPTPPPHPPFWLSFERRRRLMKYKKLKIPPARMRTVYNPSIQAIFERIKGRPSKFLTGLEVRPIPV